MFNFSYALLPMLPFSWQKAVRCKVLSLWHSILDFSLWHIPYVFLDPCANGFAFTTENVSWKKASRQCSFWKIGSWPLLMLSFPLCNTLPSSWQTLGARIPCPYPPLTESYTYGSFLNVQHVYFQTRLYSWVTMLDRCCLPCTQTWFSHLRR